LDLSLLTMNTVIAFLLVLFRIAGMMVSAPLFNMRNIPTQVKVGFAVAIALILFPLHSANLVIPKDLIQFSLLVMQESIIGILIGFTANLTFIALQIAGEFFSMQMGLSIANLLDPVTNTQSAVVGQFFFYFAALLFLNLNIHHALIVGVDRSFNAIPLGHFIGEGNLTGGVMAERFIKLSGDMFLMALMIGAPLMGITLLLDIALSFVAKVMPQMNIFIVGLPLKVGGGLLAMIVSLPYVSSLLGEQYATLVKVLLGLYRT